MKGEEGEEEEKNKVYEGDSYPYVEREWDWAPF